MTTNIHFNSNLYQADLPQLTGDIVTELLSGSKIVEAQHDGLAWHILIERPGMLKDMKGREDETWKYVVYQTSDNKRGDFWHASSHNRTSREMLKTFRNLVMEDRAMNRYKTRRVKIVTNVEVNGRYYIVIPAHQLQIVAALIDGMAPGLPFTEDMALEYTTQVSYTAESVTHVYDEAADTLQTATEWVTEDATVGEISANCTAGRTDVPTELR